MGAYLNIPLIEECSKLLAVSALSISAVLYMYRPCGSVPSLSKWVQCYIYERESSSALVTKWTGTGLDDVVKP